MKSFTYTTSNTWQVQVAELLPGLRDEPPQFTLTSAVYEVAAWTDRAPESSWGKANVQSLRDDITAATTSCGQSARALLTPVIGPLTDALEAVTTTPGTRRAKIATVNETVEPVITLLRSGPFRVAVWQDLIAEVRAGSTNIHRAEHLAALLMAACATARHHPGGIASELTNYLAPPPAAREHDPSAAPPSWTDQQRITAGAEALRREPLALPCVAWLTYTDARLPHFFVESGDVTFFESEWCLGNAFGAPHQDFPYRDELKAAFAHDYEPYTGDHPEMPRIVIVRVDLGERSPYRAIADAAARVQPLIATVALRTGAPAWRTGSLSCLTVNSDRQHHSYGVEEPSHSTEPDVYGINGFSDALADHLPDLAGLLARPQLPGHLTEALRLATEAGQVDSRENSLWHSATIAEQTVIVLQASAVEHIGALAQANPDQFAATLLHAWPLAHHRTQLAQTVEWCLHGLGNSNNALFRQIVTHKNGRRQLLFTAAHEHRTELVEACQHPRQRAHANALLHSIGDATRTLTRLDALAAEAAITQRRLKRTRNGLVHGNPILIETVNSVRELSRFMLNVALNDAIDAVATGRLVNDVLNERAVEREQIMTSLRAGRSLHQQWQTPTT